MANLESVTDELIYKTEVDLQTERSDLWLPEGGGGGSEMDWEFRVDKCKLLYLEWINKVLVYGTVSYIRFPGINHNGKEYKRRRYICA